jgi:putative ABC transport system permease protein
MSRGRGPVRGAGPRRLHADRPHVGELPIAEDVDREVRAHLALVADELVQEGWDPAAAREEAERRFGDVDVVRRQCEHITRSRDRGVRRTQRWEAVMQDLRYAVRTLVANPGFTLVALLTLALGIGANTAIFSVVDGVLLRPLPYDDPEELMYIQERNTRGGPMAVAWANFVDWQDMNRSFEAVAAYFSGRATVLGGPEPVREVLGRVTRDFWRVFPVTPVAGRLTAADEHVEGAAPAVVVSEVFARNVLGSTDVVGRVVEVAGISAEIVGVVPAAFDFPDGARVWAPAELTPQSTARSSHNWWVVGRLHDGATYQAAADEMEALTDRLIAEFAADEDPDYLATGAITVPLGEKIVGEARRPILLLFGAAAFVLLVACTNLASTLLARGQVRAREMAVRSSLGAPRGRLVRQLLTESGVLAVAGAVAGMAVAWGLVRVIRSLGAGSVPRIENVGLDARVLFFSLLVALATAVLFGLLPALRLTDGRQAAALRAGGRGEAGSRTRIWGALIGTEVALALVLLVGAGLLVRSLGELTRQNAGFDDSDVLTVPVMLRGAQYAELADHRMFWERFLAGLESRPEVSSAGVISTVPMAGFLSTGRMSLDGDPNRHTDGGYVVASRGAFEALDVRLVRGRLFDEREGPDDPHAVVVSRSFADANWPGEDPVGKQVSGGGMDDFWDRDPPLFATVIGVVEDVRFRDLARDAYPTVYFAASQRPFRLQYSANLVVEAADGDASALASIVRNELGAADPDVPVEPRTLASVVRGSLAQRTFVLTILGGFSVLGLVLAAVGIYGVVGYSVARQTREIGVRLALGASPAGVKSRVLGQALRTVALGLIAGIAGALLLTRLLQGFLFGVSATDPATFVAMAVVLLAVAFVASWIPATRSTRIDPMITMRAE